MAAASVARLGTINADGSPHLVPCTFVLDGDVVYSAVDHKPKRSTRLRRLANIERDPRVTLLVDHYAADWSRLWWVRLDGTARILAGAHDGAIDLLVAKYGQYRRRRPAGPVIAIDVVNWSWWEARSG